MGQVKCKIIGVIHFVDGAEVDYKIFAVDSKYSDVDSIEEISDLQNHPAFAKAEAEILNWLKFYKTVDNNGNRISNPESKVGKVILGKSTSAAEALKVIRECRKSYRRITKDERIQNQEEYREIKWTTPNKRGEDDLETAERLQEL